MLEKAIEAKLMKAVKEAGGKAYKFVSPGNDGVPDRLITLPGGHVGFVELKQKGKKPTKLQELRIRQLQEMGCTTLVLDDVKDIPTVLFMIQQHVAHSQITCVRKLLEEGGRL